MLDDITSKILNNIRNFKNGSMNESSLNRLWQHIQNRKPFAIISLNRSGMSDKEKKDAHNRLNTEVRNLGYGFIELNGGYVEGGSDVVAELSLMIPNTSQGDAISLGQIDLGYGTQDSILYCDGSDFLGYISTNTDIVSVGSVIQRFNYGNDKDSLPIVQSAISEYFSMLKKGSHSGKKFSFVPEN